tara:strand:- start:2255 stop:5110 length:2856 start_codon:yes stop_codon:yes gene_type:complete
MQSLAPSNPTEAQATPAPDQSIFRKIADTGFALDATFSGLTSGVVQFVANTAGGLGLVDQDKVDKFTKMMGEASAVATEGRTGAKVLSAAGSMTGQYILPAVTGFRALRALGASPVLASLVADSLTGYFGISPNDENVFNMISEDTTSPAAAAVRNLLATDPDNEDWQNRLANAGEALALLGGSEALIRGLPAAVTKSRELLKTDQGQKIADLVAQITAAGGSAVRGVDQALDRGVEMMGGGNTLGMGVGPVPKETTLTKILRQFSRAETGALQAASGDPKQFTAFKRRAAEVKSSYPTESGWSPIEATGAKVGNKGETKVTWRQIAYGFVNAPSGVSPEEHFRRMTDTTVSDVGSVVERARSGDVGAQEIIRQARWYRDMRSRLRAEFGGLGDTFADLLGATSAQTGVEQNWNNGIEILRRFTRGEYDDQIKMYTDRLEAGESVSPTLLQQLDKAGEFALIKSAAGKLFNTNSPAATGALLDVFRRVKAGSAPKTINFTGNLIGYSNDATIDVWAARYLRDIAGLPRIPPPAEKAVGGKHLTGSTLENPKISGEFKFGQRVFADAVAEINSSNIIKEYDPSLGDLGADDLQALVWFLEKEKWTKNNWTTKAGEGGSLDYEASLAGAADPAAVLQARRAATETFSPPKQRKREADEQYALRVDEARTAFDAQRAAAEQSIEQMAAPLGRTVLGVARERPGNVPTNVQQAELASELTTGIADDTSVVAFQTNNTYGEFMGELERSLNAEFVTRSNFDSGRLTRNLVEAGKKYDQDAVFVSKVLREPTEQSRPGVEIYFTRREGVDMAQRITAMLREKGVDGFTFITDARQMDRVDVQAASNEATAGLTGIRFQYIPEFDDGYDAARNAEIMDEKQRLFAQVIDDVLDLPGVAQADVVHYDTQVFRRATDTDWMTGGETYDAYLGTASGRSNRSKRTGQPFSSGTASADRGTQ